MSYSITDFLGLKNVLCTFIEENSLRRVVKIETQPHKVVRPCCGRKTKRIHDYRWQIVKLSPKRNPEIRTFVYPYLTMNSSFFSCVSLRL